MKTRLFVFFLAVCCSLCFITAQEVFVQESAKLPAHPRILLKKGEERTLLSLINRDADWKAIHKTIIEEADKMIDQPVSERIKEGKRLLAVSRTNLRRIYYLSYAYRMTGNEKYFKRAEAEMLKAATFVDWNPSHFLDVGEMTMAMAIGYDWLYSRLSATSKKTIEDAIINLGFTPSWDSQYNGWSRGNGNWNQVCNGGLSYGAMAIFEKDPAQSAKILNRALNTMQLSMAEYGSDGGYPEGVGYWEYGTSFNAMFLSAFEKIFKTDFGIAQKHQGFMKSGQFVLNMVSPSLKNFAYSDNGRNAGFFGTMFWFFDKTKDETILYNIARVYKERGVACMRNDRLAPSILIWGAKTSMSKIKTPTNLNYKTQGISPVCVMRSSWTDPNAAYLGMKMGTPGFSHAHMDNGEFIFERDGIMWSMDMGGENYYSIESKGVDMWNMTQESQRWDIFRYNNYAHSTLTFNKKLQLVKGKTQIDNYVEKANQTTCISNLTPVYEGQIKEVKRAVSLVDKKYAVIEDEITSTSQFTMLTWTLVTEAEAKVVSDKVLLLEKNGKKMYLKVDCGENIHWNIKPAVSEYTFNNPNPGISIVSFDTDLKRDAKQIIKVYMIPDENKDITYQSVF